MNLVIKKKGTDFCLTIGCYGIEGYQIDAINDKEITGVVTIVLDDNNIEKLIKNLQKLFQV